MTRARRRLAALVQALDPADASVAADRLNGELIRDECDGEQWLGITTSSC